MHFDDRLDTVLKQPVRGREIARVQYVQLLDLLGKTRAESESPLLDPAYARLSALAENLSGRDRAALVAGSGLKLRNPALIAFLSENEPAVATAAIDAAELEEQQWLDLVPSLPVQSRGVLRHRRDLGQAVENRLERLGIADRGLPPAEQASAQADNPATEAEQSPPPAPPPEAERQSSIGELVRRIELYRRTHPAPALASSSPATDAPRLPLGDHDLLPPEPVQRFDFVTDPNGRIERADADCAPMVVGAMLASLAYRRTAGAVPSPAEALRLRQPIEAQVVSFEGAPAICGDWRIDAAPLFDAATGNYTGHAGRARRLSQELAGQSQASALADRMRQVLHELRNPAGGIQMSAECIQQQVAGSVAHEYRAIAATIASDCATVLAGLDELDRLVKFDAGVSTMEAGETDLAATVEQMAALLERPLAQRESGFVLELPDGPMPVAVSRSDLERLVWRLLAALAGAAGPVERLSLAIHEQGTTTRLDLALPGSLRHLSDEELFAAQARERGPAVSAGMFGLGFTLRLAAAEARSAGGSLRREDERLVLELPAASEPSAKIRSH